MQALPSLLTQTITLTQAETPPDVPIVQRPFGVIMRPFGGDRDMRIQPTGPGFRIIAQQSTG